MNNIRRVSAAFLNRKPLYRNDFESASTFFGKFLQMEKNFKPRISARKMTISGIPLTWPLRIAII
jgi:hypothetical protein